jgi:hypothetical protein
MIYGTRTDSTLNLEIAKAGDLPSWNASPNGKAAESDANSNSCHIEMHLGQLLKERFSLKVTR